MGRVNFWSGGLLCEHAGTHIAVSSLPRKLRATFRLIHRRLNEQEDNHCHCGGLGHGSRPRVRTDRHDHTTGYYDYTAWHYHHDTSGYDNAAGNNYHPAGYDHVTGNSHAVQPDEPAERERYHGHNRNDRSKHDGHDQHDRSGDEHGPSGSRGSRLDLRSKAFDQETGLTPGFFIGAQSSEWIAPWHC